MKTIEDIANYYREHGIDDILGFIGEVLLPYLPADVFREFAKPDADLSDWKAKPLTVKSVIAEMEEYMEFAWTKVEDHRGISASRSVEKMTAWLWLLEDKEMYAYAKDENHYTNYGAPVLMKICEVYGFAHPDSEGVKRMARGEKCSAGCDGCGASFKLYRRVKV